MKVEVVVNRGGGGEGGMDRGGGGEGEQRR